MIVVMRKDATEKQIQAVIETLVSLDRDVHRSTGAERTILGAVGPPVRDLAPFEQLPGVEKVIRISPLDRTD